MLNIAVLGSSHVNRMNHDNEFLPGITFTRYFGKSGGRVENMDQFMSELMCFDPALLILQIGGNDIHPNKSPEKIADDIFDLCHRLLCNISSLRCVFVGALFLRIRPRYLSSNQYEEQRRRVNECLQEKLCDTTVFWRHKRIAPSCLSADGVHLNVKGNTRLCTCLFAVQ